MPALIRCLLILTLILLASPFALSQDEPEKKSRKEKQAERQEEKEKAAATLAAEVKAAQQLQRDWAQKLKLPAEMKSKSGVEFVLIPPDGKKVEQPFWLGKYEVTKQEWLKLDLFQNQKAPGHFGPDNPEMKEIDTSRLPVELIGWVICLQYCNKLSEAEGLPPYYGVISRNEKGEEVISGFRYGVWNRAPEIKILGGTGYRLPTWAEFGHAARGGTTSDFYFGTGKDSPDSYLWHAGNSSRRVHPVGEKTANPWGLHDILGNVREFVQDLRPLPGTNKFEALVLGGGYAAGLPGCMPSEIAIYPEQGAGSDSGFRVARAVDDGSVVIVPGQFYRLQLARSQKALSGGPKDDSAKVRLLPIDKADETQQWKFVKAGDYYQIVNRTSGLALNIANASGDEGAELIQWDAADPGENQQWTLEKHGDHFALKARHSGLVIDVEGEARKRKSPVIQSAYREGRNQLFEVVPIR